MLVLEKIFEFPKELSTWLSAAAWINRSVFKKIDFAFFKLQISDLMILTLLC